MAQQFRPNSSAQRDFLLSEARFVAFVGGVGSGKTCAGAVKSVLKLDGGYDGAIVGPDFPQFAKSTWPEFAKWCPWSRCTNKHLDHPYTQKKILTFDVRGKEVTVYYGGIEDPHAWAGPNLNWVWMDEAGRKKTRKAFDVMAARIRLGPQPQLFITTTPNGVRHWLYEVFVQGLFDPAVMKAIRDSGFAGKVVEYFHGRTKDNRHNLDDLYYLTLTGMYDGNLSQQELEGAFISMEGRVWENFQEQPTPERPYSNVTPEAEYIGGVPVEWWVDDGFTRGHPRVILFAQVIPPYVNVFDEIVVEYEVAEETIRRALDKPYPRPSVAYVDSSAAELRHRLWDADIDTVSATHDVAEGIKHTAAWICNAQLEAHLRLHPRCSYSIAEVQAYVVDERGRPVKAHDNVADAIRYGLWSKQLPEIVAEGANYRPPAHDAPVDTPLLRLPHVPRTTKEAYYDYVQRMLAQARQGVW